MRILVSEKLSENRFKTPEGYLICTNAILARTGKQTYLRREVFGDSCNDGDSEVEVDRTAEEVFAPETLASFENKPLCVEHPDEDVNAENHNLLSVGYVRDVKKDVVDGNEVMTATLVITDKYGIDEVESGRKTDLSCGYDCDIIDDEHPQQRHIRGNHVAICERGRAGIARIVDSIKDEQYLWNVGFINRSDRSQYVDIIASSDAEARAIVKKQYNPYHIFECTKIRKITSRDENKMEDNMKKYAEDKHGRTFTLEEIEGGKVKATNMGGREKIFSGWKEAEEEFGKRGIAILDSFYDIVEDSVKDMKVSHDNIREQPVYVMQSDIDKNLFFYIGKTHAMKEGEFTYAQYDMEGMTPDELRKDLEAHGWHKVARGPASFIDEASHEDRLWKVYLTGGIDANNIMYVKADNEAMARKIAERNTDEKIIKITEYGDTPLTKIDKERILKNPNRYFDSEKKIEKIAKIVSKLNDDRFSPSTYRALKELGVRPEQYKNWNQEQASRFIAQRKANTTKSSKTSSSTNKNETKSEKDIEKVLKKFDKYTLYKIAYGESSRGPVGAHKQDIFEDAMGKLMSMDENKRKEYLKKVDAYDYVYGNKELPQMAKVDLSNEAKSEEEGIEQAKKDLLANRKKDTELYNEIINKKYWRDIPEGTNEILKKFLVPDINEIDFKNYDIGDPKKGLYFNIKQSDEHPGRFTASMYVNGHFITRNADPISFYRARRMLFNSLDGIPAYFRRYNKPKK